MRLAGLVLLGSLVACATRPLTRLALAEDWTVEAPVEQQALARSAPDHDCTDPALYVPDTNHLGFWPIKVVRLNAHVVDRRSQPFNLDTMSGPGRLTSIVDYANLLLTNNGRMVLPVGETAPAVPTQFRLRLSPDGSPGDDGIAFHYDEEVPRHVHKGRGSTVGNGEAFQRYHYRADSILNTFILAYPAESAATRGPGSGVVGVAHGARYIKLIAYWDRWMEPWDYDQSLAHEVAHVYGLAHTWAQDDGCDDTPRHPNHWNVRPGVRAVSNNLMDYTANSSVLSPCQVGRIQAAMAREGSAQRRYLEPNWCAGRAGGDVTLRDSLILRHATDLEGDLTLEPGAYLDVRCRLSLPRGKRILVRPGATLVVDGGRLHNSCGLQWAGVVLERERRDVGELVLRNGGRVEDVPQPVPASAE